MFSYVSSLAASAAGTTVPIAGTKWNLHVGKAAAWAALVGSAAATAAIAYYGHDRVSRAIRHGIARGNARALAKGYSEAIHTLIQPLEDGDEVESEEVTKPGPRWRKLRYVVLAGKARFGAAPRESPANRIIVSRFVREYMQGQHGSPLNMPLHAIARWEPLVTLAILTPSYASIAALELRNQSNVLSELHDAHFVAANGGGFWATMFGVETRPEVE